MHFPLLPGLGSLTHTLHQALDLTRRDVNAAGLGQVQLGLLVTGFIGPFQTENPGQSRRVTSFQTQRRIGGIVPLPLAFVIVIVPLQFKPPE
jgi:hypothetical protein